MASIAKKAAPLIKAEGLEIGENKSAGSLMNFCTKLSLALIFICEFLVIYNNTFESVTGPIFIVTMVFLQFTEYFYVPFAVLFVTYGALGAMFGGSLGVYLLLLPLLILRLFITKFSVKIRFTDFIITIAGLFHIVHLCFCEPGFYVPGYNNQSKKLIFMVSLILWLSYIRSLERDNNSLVNKMMLAFAVTVVTNAAASLITGNSSTIADKARLGLTGVGLKDPNIAAMFICISFAVILSSKYLKTWIKVLLSCVLMATLITTVSISGFIGITITLFSFLLFMVKDRRNITLFLVIILVALLVISLFPVLNITSESESTPTEYLDYYQQKLTDKLGAFQNKNYDVATSGRSTLTKENLNYLSTKNALTQLFGGASVNPYETNVSHNSFADIILQYGYVGFTVILLMLIYKLFSRWGYSRKTGDCMMFICKIIMIYWSLSLSLFDGNGAYLWFSILLMF